MTSLVVSAEADRDIDAIYRTLRQEAGLAIAAEYDSDFDALFVRLLTYPCSGPARPKLGAGVRIGLVTPYIVVYRYDEENDRIDILRVLHGRRNISAGLIIPRGGPT